MPTNVDWTKLGEYENRDMTIGSQELTCTLVVVKFNEKISVL